MGVGLRVGEGSVNFEGEGEGTAKDSQRMKRREPGGVRVDPAPAKRGEGSNGVGGRTGILACL